MLEKFRSVYKYDLLAVFCLGLMSCFLGLVGILGVVYVYIHNIWGRKMGKRFSNNKDLIEGKKMNIFRKMEIITMTCTGLAAICDIATVVVVRSSGIVEEFQDISVSGCFVSKTSLLFSDIGSMLTQIELLGWLEVGFDFFDVMISMFFLNEEYRVNEEIRAQLKEMKQKTIEMQNQQKLGATGGTNQNTTDRDGPEPGGFNLDESLGDVPDDQNREFV